MKLARWLAALSLGLFAQGCATEQAGDRRSYAAFLYASGADVVYGFGIDAATGGLSALPGSPFRTATPRGRPAVWDEASGLLWSAQGDPLYRVDRNTGALTGLAASGVGAADNPTSFVVDPSGRFAYRVGGGRVAPGGQDFLAYPGYVRAFALDAATGALRELSDSPYGGGFFPAKAWIVGRDQSLLVCNEGYYGKYSVPGNEANLSVYRRDAQTGALTAAEGSPFEVPCNAPWRLASVTASGRLLVASDGESETIDVYRLEETDGRPQLAARLVERNSWYHAFAVDAAGQWLVASAGSRVGVYAIDLSGARLERRDLVALDTFDDALRLDPSGRWLFRSAYVTAAQEYWTFVHRLDRELGRLLPVSGSPVEVEGASARSVVSDAAGERLYALGRNGRVGAFRLDAQGRSVSALPGAPSESVPGAEVLLFVPRPR